MHGNHKMCYHLCFKHMSRLQTSLVLGPEDNEIKEIIEFYEIEWILWRILKIIEIYWFSYFLRKSVIRAEIVVLPMENL